MSRVLPRYAWIDLVQLIAAVVTGQNSLLTTRLKTEVTEATGLGGESHFRNLERKCGL